MLHSEQKKQLSASAVMWKYLNAQPNKCVSVHFGGVHVCAVCVVQLCPLQIKLPEALLTPESKG